MGPWPSPPPMADLQVVEIQYVEHAQSMHAYLARREELKVARNWGFRRSEKYRSFL